MKIQTLVALLVFFFTVSVASAGGPKGRRSASHKPESKSFVGLSVGAGLPLNEFAKSDSIEGYGYAKIGIDFNLTAGYKILPFLGVMGMIGGTISPYNVDALAARDTLHPIYTAKSYFVGKYMAGPFVYFTAGKAVVSLRALAGLSTIKFPIITRSTSGQGYSSIKTEETPSAVTFAYDVGISANIKISRIFGLLVNADYYGAKVKYSNRKTTTNTVFSSITTNSESTDKQIYIQNINLFNFTVGFSLNF